MCIAQKIRDREHIVWNRVHDRTQKNDLGHSIWVYFNIPTPNADVLDHPIFNAKPGR